MKLRNILTTSSLILVSSEVSAQVKTVFMCKACPKGTYSDGKSEACTPCDFGEYQENTASSSCKPCAPGTYQNKTGQESCPSCDIGTWAPLKSKNCTNCIDDGKGKYAGVATCNPKTGHATSCKPGYAFTPISDGSTDGTCQECQIGTYSAGGTMSCQPCASDDPTDDYYLYEDYSCNFLGLDCSHHWVRRHAPSSGTVCYGAGGIHRIWTRYCQGKKSTHSKDIPSEVEKDGANTCPAGEGCEGNGNNFYFCNPCSKPYFKTSAGNSKCDLCESTSSTSPASPNSWCPDGSKGCSSSGGTIATWVSPTQCDVAIMQSSYSKEVDAGQTDGSGHSLCYTVNYSGKTAVPQNSYHRCQ